MNALVIETEPMGGSLREMSGFAYVDVGLAYVDVGCCFESIVWTLALPLLFIR